VPLKPYGDSLTKLFSVQWRDALRVVPEMGMTAQIEFYLPAPKPTYDPVTGTYTSVPTVVWSGMARVQPLRSAAAKANNADDTVVQSVLVSIPIIAGLGFDLRPEHRARVLSAPLNPLLTKYLYVANEVMDSSNPIERTFVFTVNVETKVT
jgi:hypothetical protein